MALNDTRLRTLKPKPGKTERLVADGNGLYVRIPGGRGQSPGSAAPGNSAAERAVASPSPRSAPTPIFRSSKPASRRSNWRPSARSYSPTVEVAAEQWLAERDRAYAPQGRADARLC